MDDELLIKSVQKFPNIYNKSDSNFKNRFMRETSWKSIGVTIGFSAEDSQQRWNMLRNRYAQERRTQASGVDEHSTWQYYHLMSFLSEHVVRRKSFRKILPKSDSVSTHSSTSSQSQQHLNIMLKHEDTSDDPLFIQDQFEFEEEGPEYYHNINNNEALNQHSNTSTLDSKTGNKHSDNASRNSNEKGSDALVNSILSVERLDDEDTLFGKSIGLSLRKVMSRKKKMICKIEILQVLAKYEDDF